MTILKRIDLYAKVISLLFYPSFLQAVIASSLAQRLQNQIAVWLFFLVLPALLSIAYLRLAKMPPNHKWVVPKEFRILPLSFALLGTAVFFFYFTDNEPIYLKITTLSSLLLTAFALPVTYYWKISLHMMGMGAATTFVLFYFSFDILYTLLALIFSQQVAWARMYLQSHDLWQILAGYLAGIIFFLFSFFLYLPIP